MPAVDTKEKLIKATARLVWEKGYFGTGIQEVLKKAGVPKGSLYHHFPTGKDELVIAALNHSSMRMMNMYEQAMRGTKTPVKGLAAIIEVLAEEMERSGFRYGCPLATVALEMSGGKEEIQDACHELYQMWEDALAGYLALKQIRDARSKATTFLTLIEGGFILSKAHQDASFLRRLTGSIDSLIGI